MNTHDHIPAEVIIRQREYCHRSKACLIIRRNTQQTQGRIIEIMQPAQALCTLTRKPFMSVSILKHKIQKIILSFYSLFLQSQIQGLHQTIQFDKGSVWFHCSTGESSCTTGTFNSHQLQVLQTQSSSLKDALSSYQWWKNCMVTKLEQAENCTMCSLQPNKHIVYKKASDLSKNDRYSAPLMKSLPVLQ